MAIFWRESHNHFAKTLVPLTIRHLLVECPSLMGEPRRYFPEFRAGDGSYSLSLVLNEEACIVGGATFSFLEETGFLKLL